MNSIFDAIEESVSYIRTKTDAQPRAGIILGTGLGSFADEISHAVEIPYADIPHFPVSTVKSHLGKLIFGDIEGVPVVCMAGRFHYYEGYTMQQITFPVRVLHALQVERLFVTNVSGGTNPDYEAGDLVFIRDHINLLPENPLRGPNDERLGVRFPDMKKTYDVEMNKIGLAIAAKNNIRVQEGVYTALQGPNLETPAEYRFVNAIGGDVVGMSTVPEVIVARHCGLAVTAISIVSNKCFPIEAIVETSLEDVIKMAEAAGEKLSFLLKELMKTMR